MIYRLEKEKGQFMQIHKQLIDDPNLTTNAKAILIYMLSKPDEWQFFELDIAKHFKDSMNIIRKGIKELIDKGYINRDKFKNTKGNFVYLYDVFEQQELNEEYKK